MTNPYHGNVQTVYNNLFRNRCTVNYTIHLLWISDRFRNVYKKLLKKIPNTTPSWIMCAKISGRTIELLGIFHNKKKKKRLSEFQNLQHIRLFIVNYFRSQLSIGKSISLLYILL